jgi:hypothetical protein
MNIDEIRAELSKLTPDQRKQLGDSLDTERPRDETLKLTPEQRLALNDHLVGVVTQWAKWLGIANGVFLLTSLVYVFFVLPSKAVSEAQTLIEQRLNQQLTKLYEQSSDLLKNYGIASERSNRSQMDYDRLSKKMDTIEDAANKRATVLDSKFTITEKHLTQEAVDLDSKFTTLKNTDPAKLAETLQAVQQYSQVTKSAEKLDDALKQLTSKSDEAVKEVLDVVSKSGDLRKQILGQRVELDQIREDLNRKVSLDTRYWIKSMAGDWLVGIQNPGRHGQDMKVGSPANGANELLIQWQLIDHWPW